MIFLKKRPAAKRTIKRIIKKAGCVFVLMHVLSLPWACDKKPAGDKPGAILPPEKIIVTLYPSQEQQTMHSFGASDCWTAKFIGNWQDEQKKNKIADLLFSMDTLKDGSPEGIGLSLWRFNIGGGSFEQGTASNIKDEWRREECFMNADGSYDWNKQQGQQWFLEAAKKRGVAYTLGFSLTPPVFMTQNGKAYNASGGTRMNIKDGMMDAYAGFLAKVTDHFKFDFLSPVNEPQWKWGKADGAGQEGTQAVNTEIADLVKAIAPKMENTSAKIVVGEAGQWDYIFGKNEEGCGDQARQFFEPGTPTYIGSLPQVAGIISAHSYFSTCPDATAVTTRQQVRSVVQQLAPLQTWQTEFGILGNICNQYSGAPRNTGIDYGLYVAKVIHHDLTVANTTSWQWWLAMSPYDYSDALVYINAPSGRIDVPGCKTDGIVSDSKQLWVFGNFARFVRPGMKRIAATVSGKTDTGNVLVSAYKEVNKRKTVVVLINPWNQEQTVQLNGMTDSSVTTYTTDDTQNLKHSIANAREIRLPAKSVVTVTGLYQ
ncbi:glycoside hydrolase [Niabella beijingensis]|uniref:glycoside hydrolase n=1 Tax=Niabella beijingensis TaxID=2872700 RepID=UPI001CC16BE7|nr:glycoside hydrolase [Niabella beijingensis]